MMNNRRLQSTLERDPKSPRPLWPPRGSSSGSPHHGRVLALEPNPRMADLLRSTLSINGFESCVTLDTRAASSTSGRSIDFTFGAGRVLHFTRE